jgi:CrcB protein
MAPAGRSWRDAALVAAGGAVGTGLRYGLVVTVPPVLGLPVAIISVNVAGAFLLGLLLEALSELGAEHGIGRRLRLGVGTGVLGGFTTYSTLAADTVALALVAPGLAIAYGLGTVAIGGLASVVGIVVARRLGRRTITRRRAAS